MSFAYLVPFAVGAVTVLQAGVNRRVAAQWGLGPTALLNSLVLTCAAAVVLLFAYANRGSLPGFLADDVSLRQIRSSWLVPGLAGLFIVVGLPWSIQRVGALASFVAVVAAQMLSSMVWDQLAEGIAVTPVRLLGAALALVGAALVVLH